MATVSFTAFLPEVLPQTPSCNDVMALNAVRNAAIEFCTLSLYWQETQDAVVVSATDLPIDFEAPAGTRVTQVLAVEAGGRLIEPIALDELERVADWRVAVSEVVSRYYQLGPDTLSLYPLPATQISLVLRVAYTPTRSATGIESHVYQNHLDGLVAGALSRLMLMPGQPWSNPEIGSVYRSKFMQAVTAARIGVNKSYSRSIVHTAMNQFA